ncbi:MAG: NADP-dependent oxidoreductase [Parachlamydiaceae bacterium]
MKAIVIDNFGGSDQLKLADLPIPHPKDNEIQIAIEYAGINPVDWKIREGLFKSKMPHEFPLILGWDAAGTVSAVGKNVSNFSIGDRVFAFCRKPTIKEGTYAEYICFDANHIAKIPKQLSFAQAASLPLVALTAWQALFDVAKLQKGQTVLIHAGSGGVGSLAIQLAKNAGAHVITTCSMNNDDYVTKLGADLTIDYTKEDFVEKIQEKGKGVDVVFDTIGGKTLRDSLSIINPGGCLISIVEQVGPEIIQGKDIRVGYVYVRPDGKELKSIAHLMETGKLVPPEISELPLANAAQAHDKIRLGHTRGKMVLKIGNGD